MNQVCLLAHLLPMNTLWYVWSGADDCLEYLLPVSSGCIGRWGYIAFGHENCCSFEHTLHYGENEHIITPPPFIEVTVPSREIEWPCICVRKLYRFCICFYDFLVWFWKCINGVMLFVLHVIECFIFLPFKINGLYYVHSRHSVVYDQMENITYYWRDSVVVIPFGVLIFIDSIPILTTLSFIKEIRWH
jgi:hypothetical protein